MFPYVPVPHKLRLRYGVSHSMLCGHISYFHFFLSVWHYTWFNKILNEDTSVLLFFYKFLCFAFRLSLLGPSTVLSNLRSNTGTAIPCDQVLLSALCVQIQVQPSPVTKYCSPHFAFKYRYSHPLWPSTAFRTLRSNTGTAIPCDQVLLSALCFQIQVQPFPVTKYCSTHFAFKYRYNHSLWPSTVLSTSRSNTGTTFYLSSLRYNFHKKSGPFHPPRLTISKGHRPARELFGISCCLFVAGRLARANPPKTLQVCSTLFILNKGAFRFLGSPCIVHSFRHFLYLSAKDLSTRLVSISALTHTASGPFTASQSYCFV
jgi:hypothetical protein